MRMTKATKLSIATSLVCLVGGGVTGASIAASADGPAPWNKPVGYRAYTPRMAHHMDTLACHEDEWMFVPRRPFKNGWNAGQPTRVVMCINRDGGKPYKAFDPNQG